MPPDLWRAFKASYLDARGLSVEDVYDISYDHGDSYVVAEALIEFDELFQKFRANHLYLIHRSIGLGSKSLKGRPVELLQAGALHRFFPRVVGHTLRRPTAGAASMGLCGHRSATTRPSRSRLGFLAPREAGGEVAAHGLAFGKPEDRLRGRRGAFSLQALSPSPSRLRRATSPPLWWGRGTQSCSGLATCAVSASILRG